MPCVLDPTVSERGATFHDMPKPTQEKGTDWRWFLATLVSMLLLLSTFYGFIYSDISKMEERVDGIDKHISRVETAVRIIGAKQGGDTKDLVDEALTAAVNASDSGNFASAQKILSIANRILERQKRVKALASDEFFKRALRNYQVLRVNPSPAVSQEAFSGKKQLAEYRSAISTIPPGFHASNSTVHIGTLKYVNGRPYLSDSFLSGPQAISNAPEGGFDIDGFILENVVIDNVKIIYKGGPVTLRNVHFVNCEFQVPITPKSDQLLDAVIQESNVTVS